MKTLPRYAREKIAAGRNSINSAFDNPRRRMSDKCRFFEVTSRLDLGGGETAVKVQETDGNLWSGPQVLCEWELYTKDGKVQFYATPKRMAEWEKTFA